VVDAGTVVAFFANGLVFGSILALAAVGLSLVYGILRLSNFAHGDFLTFGAFAALLTTRWLPVNGVSNSALVLASLVSILATIALVIGLEFLVWRPLRRRGATVLALIIVSIGLGIVIRNVLLLEFGGGIHFFDRPTPVSDLLLGVPVSNPQRFTIVVAAILVAALHVFLRYTRTGKAMRAVSDNLDLARVSGIDVDRIVLYVWGICGGLVAVAGVLLTLVNNNTMHVNMGFGLILPLFAAVILGGIGSPYGAIVGIGMKMSAIWIGNEYEFASAFILLILVLLIRPTGILGVRQ
jgi:neutral amino acid transport system permease protein